MWVIDLISNTAELHRPQWNGELNSNDKCVHSLHSTWLKDTESVRKCKWKGLGITNLKLHKSLSYLLIIYAHATFIANTNGAPLYLKHLLKLLLEIFWQNFTARNILYNVSNSYLLLQMLVFIMNILYFPYPHTMKIKIIEKDWRYHMFMNLS